MHINDLEMQAEIIQDISTSNGMYSVGAADIERTWYHSYRQQLAQINDKNSEEGKLLR